MKEEEEKRVEERRCVEDDEIKEEEDEDVDGEEVKEKDEVEEAEVEDVDDELALTDAARRYGRRSSF